MELAHWLWKRFVKVINVFFNVFFYHLTSNKLGVALSNEKFEPLSPKNDLYKFWMKLSCDFEEIFDTLIDRKTDEQVTDS